MALLLHRFFEDARTQVALLLIVLDLILGVVAALAAGTFRLSFVSDFLRNDVVGKVLPFFVLYGGYVYASGASVVIPGVHLEALMDGAWVLASGALVASLLNSLRELGVLAALPDLIAGDDPATPTLPPTAPRSP